MKIHRVLFYICCNVLWFIQWTNFLTLVRSLTPHCYCLCSDIDNIFHSIFRLNALQISHVTQSKSPFNVNSRLVFAKKCKSVYFTSIISIVDKWDIWWEDFFEANFSACSQSGNERHPRLRTENFKKVDQVSALLGLSFQKFVDAGDLRRLGRDLNRVGEVCWITNSQLKT